MRTRISGIAAAFVLLFAAGYTAYWYAAAAWLRDGVEAWAVARRAEGFSVAYEGPEVSGFPFRLVALLTAPRVGRPPTWTWAGDRLAIEIRPWRFNRVRLTLPAQQRLGFTAVSGAPRAVTASAERSIAEVELIAGALDRLTVESNGVVLHTPQGEIRLERLEGRARRAPEASIDFTVEIENLVLPPQLDGGLGREVARLAADATLVGALPRIALADALSVWSKAGGTLELKALIVDWGALGVTASGTLALDAELRPLAALTAEIEGYGAVLAALADAGTLKKRDAQLATTVLDLLAKPAPDGARVVKIPVTAQNGTLFVGPLSLVKLGPVIKR